MTPQHPSPETRADEERFILRSVRGKHPLAIQRQVWDAEMEFWVDADELGRFPDRDAARDFMVGRKEATR